MWGRAALSDSSVPGQALLQGIRAKGPVEAMESWVRGMSWGGDRRERGGGRRPSLK